MKRVPEIIEKLGGVDPVASELGLSYQTVHSWITRGFPAARCIEIRDLARRKGLRLSVDQILAARAKEGGATAN